MAEERPPGVYLDTIEAERGEAVARAERAEALLRDVTDEIRDLIDRGVIGQGWAATHLPKFYAARAALDAGGKTNGG